MFSYKTRSKSELATSAMATSTTTASTTTEPTTAAATVEAFKYTTTSDNFVDRVWGGGGEITEIFIPSYKVCFSLKEAFHADKPRNVTHVSTMNNETKVNPLTKINLSKEMVEKVVKRANLNAQLKQLNETLQEDNEFRNLFGLKSATPRPW